MKKFASALVLLSGLTLLAGCDAMTQGWLPIAADHRPTVKTVSVTGYVKDSAGNALEKAMVSNGASVAFTDDKGFFTLANVRTGPQSITATYDKVRSTPWEGEITSSSEEISKIVVPTYGPVSDDTELVKLIQIFPETLTASFSAEASDSAPTAYGTTTYGTGKDIVISLATPPNGAELVIESYQVTYAAPDATATIADFSSPLRVEPGSLVESGPTKNLTIKNVGPSSAAFSRILDQRETGAVEATITLYTANQSNQNAATAVKLHAPKVDDRDASRSFEVKVSIEKGQ